MFHHSDETRFHGGHVCPCLDPDYEGLTPPVPAVVKARITLEKGLEHVSAVQSMLSESLETEKKGACWV